MNATFVNMASDNKNIELCIRGDCKSDLLGCETSYLASSWEPGIRKRCLESQYGQYDVF